MDNTTLAWLKKNDYMIENLNLQGNYGNTALMKASREGNAKIVEELLSAKADISIKNVDGNTALWLACFGENPEVVSMLVNAGIEIDTLNVNGVTPLMYVVTPEKQIKPLF